MTSSAIYCDVISRTKTERVRHGDDLSRSSFLSSFMDSLCRIRKNIMFVLSSRTVSVLTRVLFRYLCRSLLRNSGNKHKNDTRVSVETVLHSSTLLFMHIPEMTSSCFSRKPVPTNGFHCFIHTTPAGALVENDDEIDHYTYDPCSEE